jgi:hypothetical protein
VRTLLVTLILVVSGAARAAEPAASTTVPEPQARWAWELDAYAGYGQLAWPSYTQPTVTWSNGGPAFAVTVAYRGEHFTHPFFDIAYVPILSSGQYVNTLQGGTGFGGQTVYSTNSSYALGFMIGPGFDPFDWLRLRVGFGLYDVIVTTNVDGAPNTVNQFTIGFLVGASVLVWRPEPFALGVEARLTAFNFPLSGIYQTNWSVGLTGRWDFARSPAGVP